MIKKLKLIFDNLKESPFASILTAIIMFVALLMAFVFSRSIKSVWHEIGYFSTQLLVILYCVVIFFGVCIVVFSYMYLYRKLEKRLYLYRLVGATKIDILFIQMLDVFVKYNIVFLVAILISEFLIGLAEGEYFPALNLVENIVIYFAMLTVIFISLIIPLCKLLFSKNTMTNKEFL